MANPSSGDFTGRQKKKLQDKHAREQAEEAQRLTMVTAAEDQRKATEVVDYTKKPAPAPQETGPYDYTAPQTDDDDDEVIAGILAETGEQADPEQIGEPATVQAPQVSEPVRAERTSVLIRAREDMKQVTVGKGTFYDFEQGVQYRVPPHVAQHLAEKEVADVLG